METSTVLLQKVNGGPFMDEYKVGCRACWAGIACVKALKAKGVWCFGELHCGWSIVREIHKIRLERGIGRTK